MKYQIKVIFKRILDNSVLIKKFISLLPEQIYEFCKDIYLSDEVSEHLDFITEDEFWQEIFSMITGEKISDFEDLEKVAGGKLSLRKSVMSGVLSFLTVGGGVLPSGERIFPAVSATGGYKIEACVEIPKPEKSLAVLNVINRNPTLKRMFGYAENANVTELSRDNIQKYKKRCSEPAGADEAANYLLVLTHALPLLVHKFNKARDLSMDGFLKLFTDDTEKYSLVNFIGKLKGDATNGSDGFKGVVVGLMFAAGLSILPGKNWDEYNESTEEDLARVQLLVAYYEDYVFQTGFTTFPTGTVSVNFAQDVNDFFGNFYNDPKQATNLTAMQYAETVLSKYIAPILTLTEDETVQLLNVFKERFPILNTVLGTFDKVKDIAHNIQRITDVESPDSPMSKLQNLLSKLIDWHYPQATMAKIKTNLEKISGNETETEGVLQGLAQLKQIHDDRAGKPAGTPKQRELDAKLTKLLAAGGCTNNESSLENGQGSENLKQQAKEILNFIEDTEAVRSDLDQILCNGKSITEKLYQALVADLPKEYEKLTNQIFDEWNKLNSSDGLLGLTTGTVADIKKITGFISNPWFAGGVLGVGGAGLLESTTGVFSKLLKGVYQGGRSALRAVRRSYNENVYNNLVLEKNPIKIKELVKEYLSSTLMFPGQASEEISEILSVNKLSGSKPAVMELSGNVSAKVFPEIHKSVFMSNFENWQKINMSQYRPQVVSRTIDGGSKEKVTLTMADTIFNTTNLSMKKLKNNTGTTLVFENLSDRSMIDRLTEARETGILNLYDSKTGGYEKLDVSKTVILISNKSENKKIILDSAEHVEFKDFTEEEYAYILADKLSEQSAKYYEMYKNEIEFSDNFIESISKEAVQNHAKYDDTERYIKQIDASMLEFLRNETSENRPTRNLKLECYIDETNKLKFETPEKVVEKDGKLEATENIKV